MLLLAAPLSAQSYYVISVSGQIYAGQQPLAPKDRLTSETQLRFTDTEAAAYIMSPSKGYFVLSARDVFPSDRREFLVAVKNALLPPSELKNTAIRAVYQADQTILLEDTYDMLSFFRGNLVYLDTLVFELDPDSWPLEDTRIEWISTNGEDTLVREVTITDHRFVLAWSGDRHAGSDLWEHHLVCHPWYGEDELEPYPFHLIVPGAEQIRSELQTLHQLVAAEDSSTFLPEHAIPYLTMRYGKVHPGHLQLIWGE